MVQSGHQREEKLQTFYQGKLLTAAFYFALPLAGSFCMITPSCGCVYYILSYDMEFFICNGKSPTYIMEMQEYCYNASPKRLLKNRCLIFKILLMALKPQIYTLRAFSFGYQILLSRLAHLYSKDQCCIITKILSSVKRMALHYRK